MASRGAIERARTGASDRRPGASGAGGAGDCAAVASGRAVPAEGISEPANNGAYSGSPTAAADEHWKADGENGVCDRQSTSTNQRVVTSGGADRLAPAASTAGEGDETLGDSGGGDDDDDDDGGGGWPECARRGHRCNGRHGRQASTSTVRQDGSLKIRSEHFSVSVNQFNYEPGGDCASQRDPLSEQPQRNERRVADHLHGQAPQLNCSLTNRQNEQPANEQDATTTAATTTLLPVASEQQEYDLLVGGELNSEQQDYRAQAAAKTPYVVAQAVGAPQPRTAPTNRLRSSAVRQVEKEPRQGQQRKQQQRQQIKHDHHAEAQTRALTKLTPHLEDDSAAGDEHRCISLVSASNSSFWAKLSNLSRSIIQQRQQQQQQSLSDSSASATAYAPDEIILSQETDSFLAPEVLSYIETKKRQLELDSTSSSSVTATRGNGAGDRACGIAFAAAGGPTAKTSNMTKTSSCRIAGGAGEQEQQLLDGGDIQGDGMTSVILDDERAPRSGQRSREEVAKRRKRESAAAAAAATTTTTTAPALAQITSQHPSTLEEQQQAQQEACASAHRSQVNLDGPSQRLVRLARSQQATISGSGNKMQPQQPLKGVPAAMAPPLGGDSNAPELDDRLGEHIQAAGGKSAVVAVGQRQHHHHQHQVKLSIATTATNTTTNTTNTTTTSTATRSSSSASSLNSCILSESVSGQSDETRLKWGKKMDFLLSIIGFAVDLANIWRFPYLVYKNGGGVFLIPYLTMLIFGGIPLFFLELCLGQYVKKGPITVWNKICPYMKGVGYCSILISWYVSFYYNVLIAWSVYFIYRSILSIGQKMPWEDCDNSWNSASTCVSISQLKELCSQRPLESCRREMFSAINVTSPASEFFVKELSQIDQSSGLNDMGYLRPELVICTMIVYLLHYFSLFRGLETSGKVVWVTATAPYMILSILLVRGLFLPGASMGIEYYLSPKLEKLADPQVWIDAAGQVFYSIGVGFGVHLTYASFNSHDNNCYRDCLMTSAVNALTSVYSGLVVFVYLGYMATNLGIEIDKVASEGYSLVFEVYPEALTTLVFARFWSILFFIMLLTLGIDSAVSTHTAHLRGPDRFGAQFIKLTRHQLNCCNNNCAPYNPHRNWARNNQMGGLEAVITGLEDEFKFAKRLSRGQLTGLVIVSSFLPALISCTQGGAYTLFWFDTYSAGVSLLFSALFETIGVVYCYGLDKFILNIESMLGKRPQFFYIICWKYISPTFLMVSSPKSLIS
jgi:solute carrier family 6 noradrenalin transporter-like protein 2